MSRKSPPPLAKVTRPLLYGAVPRERLFGRLDAERVRRRTVCVVGPPGAGKTTLVASWLDTGKVPGLWYQVDAGDADVATFYHYLGQALRGTEGGGAPPLPALTAEYRADVVGFSRRFFRMMFERLPAGSTLVLDNYQEVPAESEFHALVSDAVEEVPVGSLLVVISRRDLPDCYSRLVANDGVAFLDWDDLMLTAEETERIVRARLPSLSADQIGHLHTRAAGWAAGLTLMLEDRRREARSVVPVGTDRDMLFRYFAANILDALPASTHRFLVMSAFLPQVIVAVARDLTGQDDAERILDDLCRRHLFTHRRPGPEPVYWYHALFREFLAQRAELLLGYEGMQETRRRAARLLEARHQFEDGFELFAAAGDWPGGVRLIERHAEEFIGSGRAQTVREWIAALPTDAKRASAWVMYWAGVAEMHEEHDRAREHLAHAAALFQESGDALGEALACAGAIDTHYFAWNDFRSMRLWVDRLVPLVDRLHVANAPERELKILGSLLVGILYAVPDHDARHRCVKRISEMLDEALPARQKFVAALSLLTYANLSCETALARLAVLRAAPLLDQEEVTPYLRMWWWLRFGYFRQLVGEYAQAEAAIRASEDVARSQGFAGQRLRHVLASSYRQCLGAARHDLRSVRREHEDILRMVVDDSPMAAWHLCQSHCYVASSMANYPALVDRARATLRAAQLTGMTYLEVLSRAHICNGLVLCGRFDAFDVEARALRPLVTASAFSCYRIELDFLEALSRFARGDSVGGAVHLKVTLEQAREVAFPFANMFRWSGAASAVLLAALERGMERDYVVDSIRKLGIRPPAGCVSPVWPWPVRVRTLGHFDIEVDGVPLVFHGRAPRRSLALLKAIIAFGSRDVAYDRLVDHLWTDEEGDSARKAAEVAMVRLRKLLGRADAITVSDDRVTLDPSVVWVDADAFENAVNSALREIDGQGIDGPTRVDLLALYAGDFLRGEVSEPWVISRRLRLRSLMVRYVEAVGRHFERRGLHEEAIASYGRGIDMDPLVEAFYQGGMRACLAAGRIADGLALFRRLRDAWSGVLGIVPSAESVALAEELAEAGRRGRSAA